MTDAPEIIYLQWIPEKSWYDDTVTWCEDEINEEDIEYINKDISDEYLSLLKEAFEFIDEEYGHGIKNGYWPDVAPFHARIAKVIGVSNGK